MAELVRVAAVGDIPDGGATIVDAKKERIAIFNLKGRFYALSNTCLHKGGPIGEGIINEDELAVECPWHGWAYKLATGEKVDDAAKKLKTYAVKVKGSDVFLEI